MKSATLPSFWENYNSLDIRVKEQARKAYSFWLENPFHRYLYFKSINQEDNIWSVRITRSYRAVGILQGDTVTWFWIGKHDDYERFF
ncbi:hypothetical protein QT995_04365 [Microcoleus sp. S36b_A3]|uniref:ParE family toxin-like protein n=1 Tax=unclassified Microcoleus TaxID=2642155 RepID=UPI002FD57566